MFWYVLIGFFSAVGAFALLWLCAGHFVPASKMTVAIHCPKDMESVLLRRYRWLRELGLVRCRIVLLDSALPAATQQALSAHFPGVSFSTTEDWKKERM